MRVRANTTRRQAPGRRAPRELATRGCRPVPRLYGSGRPAFSPPTVLRGRGRIFPAPARETRTPEFQAGEKAKDMAAIGFGEKCTPQAPPSNG